mmetsp:Transcript_2889/g.6820  ORF Transcript_2889/g.6820 Transcript_2889/m.6820 type:complete len:471 (-) Transcript_2889:35-1447(-)
MIINLFGMNTLQYPLLYSIPVMVIALLLSNLNRNSASILLPYWLMGTNAQTSALAHRAGLHLKQCAENGRFLSQSLCVNSWDGKQGTQNEPDVHLIILIHGWLGNPKEMDGLKESLIEQSQIQMENEKENNKAPLVDRVVVHSVRCNNGKTSDGIVAGGQRVAVEINEVIQEIRSRQTLDGKHHPNIRLSIVGNSLGGLYGRFAISEINWTDDANDSQQQQQNKAQVIPHFFVTTATPHLGCGFQQTYLPLPRFIEHPIGNIMLRTGQDLFRLPGRRDIIQEMTFSPTFTTPLSKFHKRMAYANAHGTDFQVPLPTAAFWAPTDSIHTLIENDETDENLIPRGVALTLTTPRQDSFDTTEPKQGTATSEEISKQLDRLGWTKVLIDVRHEMPINLNEPSTLTTDETIKNKQKEWTSKELLQEFDTGRLKSLPIGHMVMVANSKNEFYRNMCKPGIPIMDYLAREIITTAV